MKTKPSNVFSAVPQELESLKEGMEAASTTYSEAAALTAAAQRNLRQLEGGSELLPDAHVRAVAEQRERLEVAKLTESRAKEALESSQARASIRCGEIAQDLTEALFHLASEERKRITDTINSALGSVADVANNRSILGQMIEKTPAVSSPKGAAERLRRQSGSGSLDSILDGVRLGLSILSSQS